jgi:hypothetical protein
VETYRKFPFVSINLLELEKNIAEEFVAGLDEEPIQFLTLAIHLYVLPSRNEPAEFTISN